MEKKHDDKQFQKAVQQAQHGQRTNWEEVIGKEQYHENGTFEINFHQ